ncbi:hypothetical protein Q8A67_005320 [Cirrhinus molitorella]|uniref:Uncharacterized protein n=1 Tax=Cirrhinus molitorella TaxID=172907 RepID=A0AA88TXB2_9TELE|nr:hypothetical protein Q8A67_005320 [Cirrhinus molitorella]
MRSATSWRSAFSRAARGMGSMSGATPFHRGKMHGADIISSSSTSYYQARIRQEETEADLQIQTLEAGDLQRVKDQHKTIMKNKSLSSGEVEAGPSSAAVADESDDDAGGTESAGEVEEDKERERVEVSVEPALQ